MNEENSRHITDDDYVLENPHKEMQDVILTREHVWRNYPKIKDDKICGCIYCLKIFKPSEIDDWTMEPNGGHTALCPYCNIDSVIGESSGYPITEEFLNKMNEYWF